MNSEQSQNSQNAQINPNTSQTDQQTNPKAQSLTLEQVRDIMRTFVDEREWHSFHTPRNLLMALVGEVGEVSEIFQWKGEVKEGLPEFSEQQKTHVGEELADVLSYLIRVSDVCGIDLSRAFQDKVEKNRKKYPKELVKGSSKKYNLYKQEAKQEKNEEQKQ